MILFACLTKKDDRHCEHCSGNPDGPVRAVKEFTASISMCDTFFHWLSDIIHLCILKTYSCIKAWSHRGTDM